MKTVTPISTKGFTLIELLIVVGILAILGTVVVIIINPTQMLTQTRDSRRLSELSDLNRALQIAAVQGITSFGSSTTVYISIPDATSSVCASLGLPALSGGWQYHCANPTDFRKIDGNGWIPVLFNSLTSGPPFDALPFDPINTTSTGLYYTYVVSGGSWELTAVFESTKYQQQYAKNDGGRSDTVFEIGTHLQLTPLMVTIRPNTCVSGPQQNYNLSNITDPVNGLGFSLCWSQTYGTTGSSVDAACTGSYLFFACHPVGATTATVAACGKRSVALSQAVPAQQCVTIPASGFPVDNNVRWYDNSSSFGWMDPNATQINQCACNYGVDSASSGTYGANQMCRHGASTGPSSGWSCGNTNSLNSDNTWVLEVYQK